MLCLTPAIRQIRPGAGVCKGGRPRRPGAGRRCRLPHEGVVQTMPSSRPTSSHRSSRRFCACIMMPGKRAAGGQGTGRATTTRQPTRIDIQCPPGRASSHCGPGTWSGPEGSSHNRFPQVPRARLVPPYFSRAQRFFVPSPFVCGPRRRLPVPPGHPSGVVVSGGIPAFPVPVPSSRWRHAPGKHRVSFLPFRRPSPPQTRCKHNPPIRYWPASGGRMISIRWSVRTPSSGRCATRSTISACTTPTC